MAKKNKSKKDSLEILLPHENINLTQETKVIPCVLDTSNINPQKLIELTKKLYK